MARYFAAPNGQYTDEDARIIGPELHKLAERGASSPSEIVAYAKRTDSPLREYLHLDRPVEESADRWYREQARRVARSIFVEVRVGGRSHLVRAFHSVVVNVAEPETDSPSETKRRYVTIQQVRSSEPMAEQVLDDAMDRLSDWQGRYALYRDVLVAAHPRLADVFRSVDGALQESRA